MNTIEQLCAATAESLRRNGMSVQYVPDAASVREAVAALLHDGDTIGLGGSVTLSQCGILELAHDPRYRLFDRYAPNMTAAQAAACFEASLTADVFLTGANAITADGLLYNVDGRGNRAAAFVYGPKRVIVVAGYNKIVPDLEAAVERVRTVAAPLNNRRLKKDTYCAKEGRCVACGKPLGAGCASPDRICRQFVVTGAQAGARIHVILVGEALGY